MTENTNAQTVQEATPETTVESDYAIAIEETEIIKAYKAKQKHTKIETAKYILELEAQREIVKAKIQQALIEAVSDVFITVDTSNEMVAKLINSMSQKVYAIINK